MQSLEDSLNRASEKGLLIDIIRPLTLSFNQNMSRKKLPEIMDRKEAEKLLKQPSKKSKTGIRNRAILKLILNAGLRVSEVTKLRHWEIDSTFGALRITEGKGGKDRDLKIPPIAREDLKKWEKIRSMNAFYFSTSHGTKISSRYLEKMVKRYAAKARIKKRVTPHSLRHYFATEFYRQTRDIETLRMVLGHESIQTTQIYITLAGIEVMESMERFIGI